MSHFLACWDDQISGQTFFWDQNKEMHLAYSYKEGLELLRLYESIKQDTHCLMGFTYEWGIEHAFGQFPSTDTARELSAFLIILDSPNILPSNELKLHLPFQGPFDLRFLSQKDTKEEWIQKVHSLKNSIQNGDSYQGNLTSELDLELIGSITSLYLTLRNHQKVSYGLFLDTKQIQICSFSPELFFHRNKEQITMKPMKGTAPRAISENGSFPPELSLKNKAENIMIVDLIRNDLTKIAKKNSVQVSNLLELQEWETIFQWISTIYCELPETLQLEDLLESIFPSGSITGCPKLSTSEILFLLENRKRGFYTGMLGYSHPEKGLISNVAIRSLVGREQKFQFGVGCGITWNSDPEQEFEELRWKSKFLEKGNQHFYFIESIRDTTGDRLPPQWGLHVQRLEESATALGFPFSEESMVQEFLSQKWNTPWTEPRETPLLLKCRLTLNRRGEFSYQWEEIQPITKKLEILLSPIPTHSSNPFTKYKTSMRSFYEEEFQKASSLGFDDVFFINERGEITECSRWNLFLLFEDGWATPDLRSGLLPGIARQVFMEEVEARESRILLDDLDQVLRIKVTNAVRGVCEARFHIPNLSSDSPREFLTYPIS